MGDWDRSTRQLAQGHASRSFRQEMRWVTPSLQAISRESPVFFKLRGEKAIFVVKPRRMHAASKSQIIIRSNELYQNDSFHDSRCREF